MMLWPSYLYNGISATWEDHIYIETMPLSFPTGLLLTKRYTQYESHNWQHIIASWVQLWRLMSKQMDGQRSHGISQTNFKPRCLKGRKFWQSQAITNRIRSWWEQLLYQVWIMLYCDQQDGNVIAKPQTDRWWTNSSDCEDNLWAKMAKSEHTVTITRDCLKMLFNWLIRIEKRSQYCSLITIIWYIYRVCTLLIV